MDMGVHIGTLLQGHQYLEGLKWEPKVGNPKEEFLIGTSGPRCVYPHSILWLPYVGVPIWSLEYCGW